MEKCSKPPTRLWLGSGWIYNPPGKSLIPCPIHQHVPSGPPRGAIHGDHANGPRQFANAQQSKEDGVHRQVDCLKTMGVLNGINGGLNIKNGDIWGFNVIWLYRTGIWMVPSYRHNLTNYMWQRTACLWGLTVPSTPPTNIDPSKWAVGTLFSLQCEAPKIAKLVYSL
jgi:hypothetical protein